jgi:hypothetical protein
MDHFVTRNKRSASSQPSGTQPPASRPRNIESTDVTDTNVAVEVEQSDEHRDHGRDNVFDDLPQDVIIIEHDADDINVPADTNQGRVGVTASATTSASVADSDTDIDRPVKQVEGPLDISRSPAVGPTQPTLSQYPRTVQSRVPRSFQGAWFSSYPWLEYSVESDAAFCFACRHFPQASHNTQESVFTTVGYKNWKKATYSDGGFISHVKSDIHVVAMTSWADYKVMAKKGTSVAQMVSDSYLRQVAENRLYIQSLGEVLLLTATQDIAQRGHREDKGSHNKGNFLETLHLLARYNTVIASKLTDLPGNAKYYSPQLQNEMIETLTDMVRQKIIKEVKAGGEFAIMVDETKDVRKLEQLSLVIRYFYKGEIKESFLQFESVQNLDAASLSAKILSALDRFQLDYREHLVGQGYDGAAVMSGKHSGVSTRITEQARFSHYIHCYAHRLNLVLVDVAKAVPEASQFFSLLERLYVFFSGSYVHRRWIDIQSEMFPNQAARELQRLSDTRWACRYYACRNFQNRFSAIVRLLTILQDDDNSDRAVDARGLLAQIDGSFILLLEIFCTILGETKTLSDQLQATSLDLAAAVDLIQVVAIRLTELRSEEEFEKLWVKVTELTASCDIHLPEMRRKRPSKAPARLQDAVVMETTGQRQDVSEKREFRTQVYYPILDSIIGEMDRRFSGQNCGIMAGIQSLNPMSESFLKSDVIAAFAAAYESNIDDLQHELHQTRRLIERKKRAGLEAPASLLQLAGFMEPYRDAFHELYRLCQIAVTIPVSSAACERSFSALKRIKTYLRNSMTDSRLSSLGMLSIESERAKSLNMTTFVDVFAANHKNSRIHLF